VKWTEIDLAQAIESVNAEDVISLKATLFHSAEQCGSVWIRKYWHRMFGLASRLACS